MKFGTFRQQIGLMFMIGSAISSLICDYLWAYHFAPYDAKFPTPSSVFELSVSVSVVVIAITTALFAGTLFIAPSFKTQVPTVSDYAAAIGFGLIVQPAIFVSPHAITGLNPFLGVVFIAPICAGLTFGWLRKENLLPPSNADVDASPSP